MERDWVDPAAEGGQRDGASAGGGPVSGADGDGGRVSPTALESRTGPEKKAPQATQADRGWRTPGASPRQATQADQGWRTPGASPRQATQADQGWRTPGASPRQATQADQGWRTAAQELLDPGNLMNKAAANAFPRIEEFRTAVGRLPELESSTGTKYKVKRTLVRDGGESAILLCAAPDGRDVAAKVYYEPVNGPGSSISARTRVLEYMGTEDGRRYTLAVEEIGLVELGGSRYYFEIMPYCSEGDLTRDPACSFEKLVELTAYLNEALHSMHSAGILHRDIKPANLYHLNGRVVIGDFGVAKLAKAGVTGIRVGTEGFCAPETLFAVSADEPVFFFDEACDYYALGVTLGCLFEGRYVYEGMNSAMVTLYIQRGRLPLTRTDPHRDQLENLLNGLCRYDARYRFGYEDVCRWLTNHDYTGGVLEDEWPKGFRMLGKEYRDEKSLFEGITQDAGHWNEGRALLYGKYFENFFMSFRTDLARAAQTADETWRTVCPDKGLAVFLKTLFPPGPIVWRGHTFNSLGELAERMKKTQTPAAYGEILQKRCVSHWLANTEGIRRDQKLLETVETIENTAQKEPKLACYWFGNSFSKCKELRICGQSVSTVGELIAALFRSPRAFFLSGGYERLMGHEAALYGFLYSFGCQAMVEAQWRGMPGCSEFHKAVMLFGMLDAIAEKEGEDTAWVRGFFLNYGPVGVAAYVKRLVDRDKEPVYQGLDAEGKRILDQIAAFQPAGGSSVSELFQAYTPLLSLMERLQAQLAGNPFCVSAGVYEERGILCRDLSGCFAFSLYGRAVPLGFHGWIETVPGGERQ